jgi:hypothetical protein
MGYYVTPLTQPKEEWLKQHALREVASPPTWADVPTHCLVVCLVDNGMFTAAGIAVDEEELERFKQPDKRKRRWFIVPKLKIFEVEPAVKAIVT